VPTRFLDSLDRRAILATGVSNVRPRNLNARRRELGLAIEDGAGADQESTAFAR
jgi:hypothetical protein